MTDPRTEPNLDQDQNQEPDAVDSIEANPEEHPAAAPIESETETAESVAPDLTAAATEPVAPVAAATDEPFPVPIEYDDAPSGPLPYAVIQTGGKQYRVSVGDHIAVEKLDHAAGSEITLERVLLVGGDGATRVGTPVVEGVAVTATVDDHFRGEKIVIFKYKAKKRYRRRQGHRQSQTKLTITGITG